jgi:hypothetical protein
MMMCNTQNYWVFGLFRSSSFLDPRKHDVSETDPVSEMSCLPVSRMPDDEKSPKTQ